MDQNTLDPFEQRLKESLKSYEVPYNSAHWSQMDRALSSGVKSWNHGRTLLVGALLAGALLVGGAAYYMGLDSGKQEMTGPQPAQLTAVENTPTSAAPTQTGMEPVSTEATIQQEGASQSTALAEEGARPTTATSATSAPLKGKTTKPEAGQTTPPTVPKSNALFHSSVSEACPGSPVDFTVANLPEDGIFLWNFGDGNFSNKPDPEHSFTKPGTYKVMLSMSGAGTGTMQNKLSSGTITIHEAPLADFKVVKRDFAGQFPMVDFQSRAMGASSHLWDFGDGTKSAEPNPEHVYKSKGKYNVVLTVTNATGCTDSKTGEVEILRDFTLGALEQFSPDGDGQHDTFMPEALRMLNATFHLTVYDASGAQLFTTDNPDQPWTGKVNNQGAFCAAGEYVWAVEVRTDDKATETFTGKVNLVR
ncbi:MAG: PKD domain-containing protein [Flavobacteriales bacterium]